MNGARPAPRPASLARLSLAMVGLALGQIAFDALRGTGVLRQVAFLAGLAVAGLAGLAALVWLARRRERIDRALERLTERLLGWLRRRAGPAWTAWSLCLLVLPAWVLSGWLAPLQGLLVRLALFWLFSLLAASIMPHGRNRGWIVRWGISALALGTLFELGSLLQISSDPFSLGWSEASRYYYASLFFAPRLYGRWLPLPILHPTRYLLQAVPFFISGAPIWLHRMWQVMLWLGLTYAGAWALARRIAWPKARLALWAALWLGLFFFQGAVYYHLMLSAVLVLAVFDRRRLWRSLAVVILASVWAGISRVNWIPVPGMLAAALYALERDQSQSEGFVGYWWRPVVWAVSGAAAGFLGQAAYVAWSGNPVSDFGTAFSSALLWYRLLPNPTFPLGVLPAISLASLPLIILAVRALRRGEVGLHGWRLACLVVILGFLFIGGLVVSVKIGGGGDLHNFDAFLLLLAVCGGYLAFDRRWRMGDGPIEDQSSAPWWLLVPVVAMPMVFILNNGGPLPSRQPGHEVELLSAIQSAAGAARSAGEPVLFLTERQLITFGDIKGIPLQPEDEKVTLMEMAMARNQPYLSRFHTAIRQQRYGLIVSEPLVVQTQGRTHAFGEENDAWSEEVALPILCAYRPIYTSASPPVQLLVPRAETSGCSP